MWTTCSTCSTSRLLDVDELDGQAAVVDVDVDVDVPVPAVVEVDELVGLVVVEDVDEDVSRGMADAFPPVVWVTDDERCYGRPSKGRGAGRTRHRHRQRRRRRQWRPDPTCRVAIHCGLPHFPFRARSRRSSMASRTEPPVTSR